jgi:hypothetical protein
VSLRDRFKTFQFEGAKVLVPRSVLRRWEKIEIEELETVLASIVDAYKHAVQKLRSVHSEPTVEGIRVHLSAGIMPWDGFADSWRKLHKSRVDARKEVLRLLKFTQYREWNFSPLKFLFWIAVLSAAVHGDTRFFIRLGKRLAEKPTLRRKISPGFLAQILLEHWADRTGLCLCWFSDKAIVMLLKRAYGLHVTEAAVYQTHQRLGLKKLAAPLIRSVSLEDENQVVCGP